MNSEKNGEATHNFLVQMVSFFVFSLSEFDIATIFSALVKAIDPETSKGWKSLAPYAPRKKKKKTKKLGIFTCSCQLKNQNHPDFFRRVFSSFQQDEFMDHLDRGLSYSHDGSVCMVYMVTFTINIPPRLASTTHTDPSWEMTFLFFVTRRKWGFPFSEAPEMQKSDGKLGKPSEPTGACGSWHLPGCENDVLWHIYYIISYHVYIYILYIYIYLFIFIRYR